MDLVKLGHSKRSNVNSESVEDMHKIRFQRGGELYSMTTVVEGTRVPCRDQVTRHVHEGSA
jgi:hypothetical protein